MEYNPLQGKIGRTIMAETAPHRWRFFRAGGFDQVRLDRGADILALPTLDQKLWAALSCPVKGLEFDRRTLELLDTDGDGRIRAGEILEAVSWLAEVLRDPEILVAPGDALPLDAIDGTRPEGARLLASARRILANLGKGDAMEITPADTADTERIFAQTLFNGDGVIPPEAASDPDLRALIQSIADCLGPDLDRSGKPGISQEKCDLFFAEAETFLDWADRGRGDPRITPLGDATADAVEALESVTAKVDEYFLGCRLAAYDPRILESSPPTGLARSDLEGLPIAMPAAGRPLPLREGVNPAWADALARFREGAVVPLLGERGELGEDDWRSLRERLAACRAWLAEKPATAVEGLGADHLRDILAGGGREALNVLLAEDRALEPEATAIGAVDKLVRLRRDFAFLLNNFVTFREFYSGRGQAVFQAGTLYLDGRSCDLCIRVEDSAKHAALATLGRIHLVYCDCIRSGSEERMTIAAAITAGDSDQLMVGRNGLFYDRRGRGWDATVVRIVEHPISIRQAFWSPYKQLARMVGETVEKIAAAKAKTVQVQMTAAVDGTIQKPAPAKADAQPFDAGRFAGIFAAIGLALGAIGTAIASVVTGFLNLSWWQMPLAVGGIVLAVSGPSIVIAAMKLRQRNLGPLLDANGWAVNSRARINIPFGTALTALARIPEGAERSLSDPYAEKRTPWRTYLALAILVMLMAVAWRTGLFARLLH
jgi:hypothetical protein